MTTALLVLRAKQIGLTIQELSLMTLGFLYEMLAEQSNDQYDYPLIASQEDFDKD